MVYVANGNSSDLSVVDGARNRVAKTIRFEGFPTDVAVNTATNLVYVTTVNPDRLIVVDGDVNRVVASKAIRGDPYKVAVDELRDRVFVASPGRRTVTVLDGATLDEQGLIASRGAATSQVDLNAAANPVYVGHGSSGIVDVVDGDTLQVLDTVKTPGGMTALAVDSRTGTVFTASGGSNLVTVIDGGTNRVVRRVNLGPYPSDIAVDPVSGRAYVALQASSPSEGKSDPEHSGIGVIDTATNDVITNISVLGGPTAIAVNPETGTVYVANTESGKLAVIRSPAGTAEPEWVAVFETANDPNDLDDETQRLLPILRKALIVGPTGCEGIADELGVRSNVYFLGAVAQTRRELDRAIEKADREPILVVRTRPLCGF